MHKKVSTQHGFYNFFTQSKLPLKQTDRLLGKSQSTVAVRSLHSDFTDLFKREVVFVGQNIFIVSDRCFACELGFTRARRFERVPDGLFSSSPLGEVKGEVLQITLDSVLRFKSLTNLAVHPALLPAVA